MLRVAGGKRHDERRLRLLLGLLFLALAVPTGAVIWQAYGQLKWESFHQYRSQAEELTARIDSELSAALSRAESRSFASYAFLNVTGDPAAGFLQRSPLSAVPVVQDLPGVIGYFQVDAEGRFSTPLLPEQGANLPKLGLSEAEYRQREQLAGAVQRILTANRLVEGTEPGEKPAGQVFFDDLGQGLRPEQEPDHQLADQPGRETPPPAKAKQYGTVQELRLDDALQKKSERFEEDSEEQPAMAPPAEMEGGRDNRQRRVEQSVLPETLDLASKPADGAAGDAVAAGAVLSASESDILIRTFESEVEPLDFATFESGELVLFRKVWREGTRYVQGMVMDREAFLDSAVVEPFRATALSAMSDLVVAVQDEVISVTQAESSPAYAAEVSGMEGDLLYSARLGSPFDAVELIYSVQRLPAGPGGRVLRWLTIVLIAVFGGGFIALHRLGIGQIQLARQQQDFVSSVSHELKTPLTSIRMYSEMLREGWADEARRQQYYTFIHDESERLSRLIANVLQLASITRNQPSFELKQVRASRLMDSIESKIATQVERAGFEVCFKITPQAAEAVVEVDEDCMSQIIINLVDNALKFSRNAETKRLEIGAALSPRKVLRISVRDFGPGIPREQIKKIFRLFYRPESELTRETVGTGIGLAIVHQLTQAMGGSVDVLNRDPGAEFGISLPAV